MNIDRFGGCCLTGLVVAWIALSAVTVAAQQRPLRTEDPRPIDAGQVLVETGFDVLHNAPFPLSGLDGELFRVPTLGLSFGLSSIAEFQVDAGFNILRVDERHAAPLAGTIDFTGDVTTDIEDPVIATKIVIQRETPRAPIVSVRVATRIPSASNESGLGSDTFDWFLTLLGGKTIGASRLVGNFGLAVLGTPTEPNRQNDLLTYGVSLVHVLTPAWTVVGEINGRIDRSGRPSPGTEERSEFRVGARRMVGPARLDGGVIIGLTDDDPDFGVTFGVTWWFAALDTDPLDP